MPEKIDFWSNKHQTSLFNNITAIKLLKNRKPIESVDVCLSERQLLNKYEENHKIKFRWSIPKWQNLMKYIFVYLPESTAQSLLYI